MQETYSSLAEANHLHSRMGASPQQSWKRGPASSAIRADELHVWRVSLDVPWSWSFDEALSLDDRMRADRFRFESDRRRFCVARASLRLILARYLKVKPGRLHLEVGDHGKPFLDSMTSQGIRFNLSHSHRLALIAVARDREVGVDIEFMRPDFANNEVADLFFSRAEADQLTSLPFEVRTQSFFNCWTRKEAYIKARGEGLSCPLDQFDVSLAPNESAAIVDSRIDGDDASRWSLQELYPGAGYAATVAVEGPCSRLVLWDFGQE